VGSCAYYRSSWLGVTFQFYFGTCYLKLATFTSFSMKKEIAETFREDRGSIVEIKLNEENNSLLPFARVDWISEYESEKECLINRFAILWDITEEKIDNEFQYMTFSKLSRSIFKSSNAPLIGSIDVCVLILLIIAYYILL